MTYTAPSVVYLVYGTVLFRSCFIMEGDILPGNRLYLREPVLVKLDLSRNVAFKDEVRSEEHCINSFSLIHVFHGPWRLIKSR